MVEVSGTSGGPLVQPPFPSRAIYSRLPMLTHISKDRISAMSPGNVCQCFSSLKKVRKYFLTLRGDLLFFSLNPMLFVCLSLAPLKEPHFILFPPSMQVLSQTGKSCHSPPPAPSLLFSMQKRLHIIQHSALPAVDVQQLEAGCWFCFSPEYAYIVERS